MIALRVIAVLLFAVAATSHDSNDDTRHRMHPDYSQDDGRHVRPQQRVANGEQTAAHWRNVGQQHLADRLALPLNENRARNVIMFLGDGMSLPTVAATRVYIGGEEQSLSFERFPHFGQSKTYCVDRQVADSACTATAYLSGVKANYGTVGINAQVRRYDCDGGDRLAANQAESIAAWSMAQCKAAGLVTTSRVTHASPSGVYAHTANRDWETDVQVKGRCGQRANNTLDIARQLIEGPVGQNLRVIMGGGRRVFRDASLLDEEHQRPGSRSDGRDLIAEWQQRQQQAKRRAKYVWNREQLLPLASGQSTDDTEYLLGLFEDDHCLFNSERAADERLQATEPTLSEMTEAAIRVLDKEQNGYFLFVESARIDMAHHETWARRALDETAEFGRAIELARRITNESDTLIVVTADHAHVMSINGYPLRGNDILGLSGRTGSDGLPYTTLSYANGPGYANTYENGARADVSKLDFHDDQLEYPASVPRDSETHGGDDVGVYASGPWSHLFVGTYEQSNIPVAMAFAAKVGPYGSSRPECSAAGDLRPTVAVALVALLAGVFSCSWL